MTFLAFNRYKAQRCFLVSEDEPPRVPPQRSPGKPTEPTAPQAVCVMQAAADRANAEAQRIMKGAAAALVGRKVVAAHCAHGLLNRFTDWEVEISAGTYQALVETAVLAEDLPTASDFLMRMEASGHQPDNTILDRVMTLYLQHKKGGDDPASPPPFQANGGSNGHAPKPVGLPLLQIQPGLHPPLGLPSGPPNFEPYGGGAGGPIGMHVQPGPPPPPLQAPPYIVEGPRFAIPPEFDVNRKLTVGDADMAAEAGSLRAGMLRADAMVFVPGGGVVQGDYGAGPPQTEFSAFAPEFVGCGTYMGDDGHEVAIGGASVAPWHDHLVESIAPVLGAAPEMNATTTNGAGGMYVVDQAGVSCAAWLGGGPECVSHDDAASKVIEHDSNGFTNGSCKTALGGSHNEEPVPVCSDFDVLDATGAPGELLL